MPRVHDVEHRLVHDLGPRRGQAARQPQFRRQRVHARRERDLPGDRRSVRAHLRGQLEEDPADLLVLLLLGGVDPIVGLHYFDRLDEDRLTRAGMVVNDPFRVPLGNPASGAPHNGSSAA